ncbi:MAG: acyltransferase [Rubellimicrobium sp.]|nr:acyltransferase [Rubellimicrobium sp.]
MSLPPPHLPYRPAIDGLRAVAVVPVVLYHFGMPGLAGGFVGVDVFFVISGFLIGGLIAGELAQTGRLRLGAFWMRRIRRLAPAYFLMLAVTALAAWAVLLPHELRAFGKEIIAATLWASNLHFWSESGYFDAAAGTRPFLHTWSLAVEEQFYIALPLVMALLWRFGRGLPVGLAIAGLLSLGGALVLTPVHQPSAFYLFPLRAWELLSGVLLALVLAARPGWRGPRVAGWAGLALILGAVVSVRAGAGFPGWQAMVPVAGAVLVLWARDGDGAGDGAGGAAGDGDRGGAGRILGHPVAVFVGLISYSLYLWHWPVLVLSGYWRGGYSGPLEGAGWLALAVALAVLAWALVERPLRRLPLRPVPILGGFAVAVVGALGVGLLFWKGEGVASRFGPVARVHIAASQDFLQDWSRCTTPDTGPLAGVETCAIGPEGAPRIVVWGDSHLRALMDGLAIAADRAGVPGVIVWHAGCPPLTGVTKTETAATPAEDAACTEATARTLAGIAAIRPALVLMVGRWAYYARGEGIGRDARNRITLTDAGGGEGGADVFGRALGRTVAALGGMAGQVALMRQVPELPDDDSRDIARALVHGRLDAAGAGAAGTVDPATLTPRNAAVDAAVAALEGVRIIDPWPLICTPDCQAVHGDEGWYFDNNHLTNTGARALVPLFLPLFEEARDG